MDRTLAADVGFEHFPIVNAVLAGLAGVAEQDAALEFIQIDAEFDAMLATRWKFDGSSAAEGGRIVVLRAGRDVDDDGLCVAADVNPIDFALPCSGKAIQRGANRHGHGAGAANAGACGSFGIGSESETTLRLKEFGDLGKERKTIAFGLYEGLEGRKTLLALNVAGDEPDAFVAGRMCFDGTRGIEGDGGIDGDRARMKQIERPNI